MDIVFSYAKQWLNTMKVSELIIMFHEHLVKNGDTDVEFYCTYPDPDSEKNVIFFRKIDLLLNRRLCCKNKVLSVELNR